jgi:hypothetical protein
LREQIGADCFDNLSENERLVLVTAHIERTIDHARMMSVLNIHPRDLSALLSSLVEKKLIYQEGNGRGTVYFLAEARLDDAYRELESGIIAKGPDLESGPLLSSGPLEDQLLAIAEPIASRKKATAAEVQDVIVTLCAVRSLRLEELEELLNRSGESLRKKHLQHLIKEKKLKLKYPTKPNHPLQAYITAGSGADKELS